MDDADADADDDFAKASSIFFASNASNTPILSVEANNGEASKAVVAAEALSS